MDSLIVPESLNRHMDCGTTPVNGNPISTDNTENKMDQIEIKRVTIFDINELQSIGRQTFFETFATENSESDMKKYLDENFRTDKLKGELMIPDSEFYFAILRNKVIGYLKLNFGQAQTELKDLSALEIERIYVLKEFHGQKVGQILYDTALQIAKRANVSYVWLGVWEKNLRAISFYKKNGFVAFDQHIFTLGDVEQTDIMMKIELK
jgi:ribosomal protein S18 acetylase RimI-like enzyme